jgi:hypothetical protein
MKPNDLPLVCLPLGLCDDDAVTLLQFLYDLTEALERHYTGEYIRRMPRSPIPTENRPDTGSEDPPFLTTTGRWPVGAIACRENASPSQNHAGLRRR